jgi:pSer/pThr/pTyr-binding forkhead associated (FHA) protein
MELSKQLILIKRLTGSRQGHTEKLPVESINGLLIGRDPSCIISYPHDTLVSRLHAEIRQVSTNPTRFIILDLDSTNGTYVNGARVSETAKIRPGDRVKLGLEGPEFQFDLETPPTSEARTTRKLIRSNPALPKPTDLAEPSVSAAALRAHPPTAASDIPIQDIPSQQEISDVGGSSPSDTHLSQPATSQAMARSSYISLCGGQPVSPEPIYLIAELKPSSIESLADSDVYLRQVDNSQGSFVLLGVSDVSGWLFPNPGLLFKRNALAPVFPHLTKDDFNLHKESIEPLRVSRVSERRWRIEP